MSTYSWLNTLGWCEMATENDSPSSRSSLMSSSADLNAPERAPLLRSRIASVIGTPTLRKVESWRENKTRSAVVAPRNSGSSPHGQHPPPPPRRLPPHL